MGLPEEAVQLALTVCIIVPTLFVIIVCSGYHGYSMQWALPHGPINSQLYTILYMMGYWSGEGLVKLLIFHSLKF